MYRMDLREIELLIIEQMAVSYAYRYFFVIYLWNLILYHTIHILSY